MNISFLQHVYYYPQGNTIFITKPYEDPVLYWGEEIGYTEMTRKEFTSLVLNGDIVKIGEL